MSKNSQNIILLSAVPVLLIIACLSFLSKTPPHFTTLADPEYSHLLTGLNLAQFKLISGDYVHPCIPMQFLTGIIIRIVYIFAGKGPDIVTDVFQRPEFYLSVINKSFIFFIAAVFFLTGNIVLRVTNEVFAGIFLQAVVFANPVMLHLMTVSMPERLVLPLTALVICLLIWYNYNDSMPRYYAILLGISIGFCVMQKYTMLPFLILPLFATRTRKEKIIYFISFLIMSALLFIPIISHVESMKKFFDGMFFHSGLYGSGKTQIFDLSSVLPNLSMLFHDMTIPLCCMLVLMIFLPIAYRNRTNQSGIIAKILKIMAGTLLVEIIMLLMVLKHFKPHYFAPAAALSFFNLYLCYEFIRRSYLLNKPIFSKIIIGLLCLIPLMGFSKMKSLFSWDMRKAETEKLIQQVEVCYRNNPIMIIPRYYGSPFIEFSLWTANYYTDNMKQYGSKLIQLYPDSYVYSLEWGVFDMAYEGHKAKDVFLKYDKFILSYYFEDTTIVNSFFRELNDINRKYRRQRVFFNQPLGYAIDEIQFLPDTIDRKPVFSITLDMETNDTITVKMQSCDIAKSGQHSLKLDDQQEYGANIQLPEIKAGDRITANVWRYNDGNKSSLVIQSENTGDLYYSRSTISESYNLWQLVKIDIIMPDTFATQPIKVYLWHNDKSSDVYFDDYSVQILRK
jgi:hypothetical protein